MSLLQLLSLLSTTCAGYGLYEVRGELLRASEAPEDSSKTLIYDFSQTQLDQISQDGYTVKLLATNPWSCDHFQDMFEDAVVAHRQPFENSNFKFMSLDKAFEQADYLTETLKLQRPETLCASLVTIPSPKDSLTPKVTCLDQPGDLSEIVAELLPARGQPDLYKVTTIEELDALKQKHQGSTTLILFLSHPEKRATSEDEFDFCLSELAGLDVAVVEVAIAETQQANGPELVILKNGRWEVSIDIFDRNCEQLAKAFYDDLQSEIPVADPERSEESLQSPQILFYTSQSCAVCHAYEVMLEHLIAEEHPEATFSKINISTLSDEDLPKLVVGGKQVDIQSGFNSVAKARQSLNELF